MCAVDSQVAEFVEDIRRDLVDIGTRNRLIHTRRSGRGKFLTIVNERADDIFRILRREGRKMQFRASQTGAEEESAPDDVRLGEVNLIPFQEVEAADAAHFTDRYLDTNLGTDALQKRLLQLARDARTAEEEQGINVLFLAIGFLQWFEDERSEITREAPLLLLPVELVRNERKSTYDVRVREDDILTNLPLQARLRDFGLSLPEVEVDDEWSPSRYFGLVRNAVAGKPRWNIDDHGMQLGFFSFARQLMQRDLQEGELPDECLANDSFFGRLVTGGFDPAPPLFGQGERLDEHLEPQNIVQVIEADVPQTRVIEEARKGRNLVVQGPPGTGKSQTITNIIAGAAHDGKTVLFMAEKMAALDVVHKRMKKCGLGHLCLELHSRYANKRKVLQEIERTLNNHAAEEPAPVAADELRDRRDELNGNSSLLHEKISGRDFSPFEALAELVGFIGGGRGAPRLSSEGLADLSLTRCEEIRQNIEKLGRLLERGGPRRQHPFAGCRELELDPIQQERLKDVLRQGIEAIDAALSENRGGNEECRALQPRSLAQMRTSADLLDLLADPPAGGMSLAAAQLDQGIGEQLVNSLQAGIAWARARRDAENLFRNDAWGTQAEELQRNLERGAAVGLKGFSARLGSGYRRASQTLARLLTHGDLPKKAAARVELARQLACVQERRRLLRNEEGFLKTHFSAYWREERTDFEGLLRTATWLLQIEKTQPPVPAGDLERITQMVPDLKGKAATLRAGRSKALQGVQEIVALLRLDLNVPENVPLRKLRERFDRMAENPSRYAEWRQIERLAKVLSENNLGALIDRLDEGAVSPTDAAHEFRYSCAEARWSLATRTVPALRDLRDADRHELARQFASLDKAHAEGVGKFIRSRHLARLPTGAEGEMGVIRGEIARQRRHMPIRKLMARAGGMVQRIKPVFLMSPISIAQFLPYKTNSDHPLRFDLLVIDEASQVRPGDAIGAIARCDQIVVVGDKKQLPPTSFFDRLGANDETEEEDGRNEGAAPVTDMESILTLCEARGINARMLEWHYRSRDPSLIRVSNQEFYENRLILPPSPLSQDESYGLSLENVPGVYCSPGNAVPGRPGTNRIEAEHVARAVSAHAESEPELSLGIATFSKRQADMVTELLELRRRENPVLNAFLREGKAEDIFVKNIENVQGDERDVIFISVGYGPAEPGGRLANMRFGPINNEGGERRLNVLFTRARARCRVFCSFNPGDIDPGPPNRPPGRRILRRFLEYAQTGQIEEIHTGLEADSPFEEDVARVIRSLGYRADHQVGSGGFRIDIGVRHPDAPGRYLLAVECDGAAYHSALSARERDRHRQEVLEGLGWEFHRIWSTDWFYRRQHETDRLKTALDAAHEHEVVVRGANEVRQEADEPAATGGADGDRDGAPAAPGMQAPPYCPVNVAEIRSWAQSHQMPEDSQRRAEIARRIVEAEGPVHASLVARRLKEAFDLTRVSRQLVDDTLSALRRARSQNPGELLEKGEFWLTRNQSNDVPVRNRADADSEVRKPDFLPPMEIAAAAKWIERECGHVEKDALPRVIARLLGFGRTGQQLRSVIVEALEE